MPATKYASIRYRILDELLKDTTRRYTLEDLAEKCSKRVDKMASLEGTYKVSTRQIRNDLNYMASDAGFEAPIISEKLPGEKKHYFKYEDPEFNISKSPLNEDDLANLKSSLFLLQRFGGTFHDQGWIEDFELRIKMLPVKKESEQLKEESESEPKDGSILVQFDHQDLDAGGASFIVPLYQAIEKNSPLLIHYEEFSSNEIKVYKISPYLLKQFNRRWFVLCFSEGLEHVTTLPLDRIKKIEPSNHVFVSYFGPGEEPQEFFEDIIGVTNHVQVKVETVEIHVHKSLLPYLTTKLLHESQRPHKATADPDWFSIKINVKPNYEMFALLLSYGPKLRVIWPESVRVKMKEMVGSMMQHYV